MKMTTFLRSLFAVALIGVMAFGSVGCLGGDDDDGDGDSGTAFSAETAVTIGVPTATLQSEFVINSAIAAAGGFGPARDDDYFWDEDEQAYYRDLDDVDGDTTWEGFIRAQFFDDGTPVEDTDLADMANIILDLNMLRNDSGATVEADYDFDVDVTGMGGGTLTIEGGGGFSYEATLAGLSAATYMSTWETVAPDHVTMPEGGGCPTGEILYTMTPYTMSIVYDGTPSADYTVFDGSGDPIANGTGTISVGCSTN